MKLLLLLSALLAALTGADAQARTPQAELVQVAARAAAALTQPAHAHAALAARPAALPTIRVFIRTSESPSLAAPRFWVERRRE